MSFDNRKQVIESLKYVSKVIKQETLSYIPNLTLIQPDYVVHGDDWQNGIQSSTRQGVIDALSQWGGQLVEVPYTTGISSTSIKKQSKKSVARQI